MTLFSSIFDTLNLFTLVIISFTRLSVLHGQGKGVQFV